MTVLRIQRQDSPSAPETQRFEEFEVEERPGDSIATALLSVRRRPVTTDGQRVAPIAFESTCRADGCGACTLLVNGHVRSACRTLLADARPKRGPVVLAPLSKFPLVRDLVVDRGRLRTARKRVHAWLGDAPVDHAPRALAELDRCTECGACFEACPETRAGRYVGPAALNEARLLNELAAGAPAQGRRLEASMAGDGVASCGKAQVCIEVCPERIPLFDSILVLQRQTTRRWLRTLLRR